MKLINIIMNFTKINKMKQIELICKDISNRKKQNKTFGEINHLTKEQIDLFIKYSKLPIPINFLEHFEVLFEYYKTTIQY